MLFVWPRRFGPFRGGDSGAGRRLADSLGGRLRAVIIGPADDSLSTGAAAVADTVAVVDHAQLEAYHPEIWLAALTAICRELKPGTVLLGNDTYAQELAARLAQPVWEGVPRETPLTYRPPEIRCV